MQALSFPIADLIIAICRRSPDDRNSIVTHLIENIKEKTSETYVVRVGCTMIEYIANHRFSPSKALGYLTQTLTLLLMDDTTARTLVAESEVVPVLLDLLLRTLRTREAGKSIAKEEKKDSGTESANELPRWVPTVLLTLDSLAQLPLTETPPVEVYPPCPLPSLLLSLSHSPLLSSLNTNCLIGREAEVRTFPELAAAKAGAGSSHRSDEGSPPA